MNPFDGRILFTFIALAWGTAALAQGLPFDWPLPDFPLGAIFLIGRARGRRTGTLFGFFYGLVADLLGHGVVVGSPIAYALAGHLGGELATYLSEESPLVILAYLPVRLLAEGAFRLFAIPALLPAPPIETLLLRFTADAASFFILYYFRGPLGLGRRRLE